MATAASSQIMLKPVYKGNSHCQEAAICDHCDCKALAISEAAGCMAWDACHHSIAEVGLKLTSNWCCDKQKDSTVLAPADTRELPEKQQDLMLSEVH